jgi:hypothetical protein
MAKKVRRSGKAANLDTSRLAWVPFRVNNLAGAVDDTDLREKIFRQMQKCLAPLVLRQPEDIKWNDDLDADYHITMGTRIGLADNLTKCFKKAGMPLPRPLDQHLVEVAKYVNDIYQLLLHAWGF